MSRVHLYQLQKQSQPEVRKLTMRVNRLLEQLTPALIEILLTEIRVPDSGIYHLQLDFFQPNHGLRATGSAMCT